LTFTHFISISNVYLLYVAHVSYTLLNEYGMIWYGSSKLRPCFRVILWALVLKTH